METVKDILNFCNEAVFYDYKNMGITVEFSPLPTKIFNRFYKTIPYTRILVCLSIIDDIIIKIFSDNIENILNDVHTLREIIIYMISSEKTMRENPDEGKDDDE